MEFNTLSPEGKERQKPSPRAYAENDARDVSRIENRRAVLAGVSCYVDNWYSNLPVCFNDVAAVAQQLFDNHFTLSCPVLVENDPRNQPTRDNILAALKKAAEEAEENDLLLFYYTGHGDVEKKKNGGTEVMESYLVTRTGHRERLAQTALAISCVREIMEASRARAKVIILDACHSGDKIRKGARISPDFIRRVFDEAAGIAVLSSCDRGEESFIWEEMQHSVFTYYLLEALKGEADRDKKGIVTVGDIYEYVYNAVVRWAEQENRSQHPTSNAVMRGNIPVCVYKKRAARSTPVVSAQLSPTPIITKSHMQMHQEPVYWAEAK